MSDQIINRKLDKVPHFNASFVICSSYGWSAHFLQPVLRPALLPFQRPRTSDTLAGDAHVSCSDVEMRNSTWWLSLGCGETRRGRSKWQSSIAKTFSKKIKQTSMRFYLRDPQFFFFVKQPSESKIVVRQFRAPAATNCSTVLLDKSWLLTVESK